MKPQKAIALRYEKQKDAAPRIVAKGAGEVADAIIRVSRESNVPVWPNEGLADALIRMELDDVIPPELYTVVAQILAHIYKFQND